MKLSPRWTPWLPWLLGGCTLLSPSDAFFSRGCPDGTKPCERSCVPTDNPETGCAQESCSPCSLAHAGARCEQGACAVDRCEAGWSDCDLEAENGCETPRGITRTCTCHGLRLNAEDYYLGPNTGLSFGDGDWTLELWFKSSSDDAEEGRLFFTGTSYRFLGDVSEGGLGFAAGKNLIKASQIVAPPVPDLVAPFPRNRWNHVAFQRRDQDRALFVNGALIVQDKHTRPVPGGGYLLVGGPRLENDRTAPGILGPTRLSRVARYTAPFQPATRWQIDEHTVAQFLVDRPGSYYRLLIDEAGEDNTLGPGSGIPEEQDLPCQ